MRTVFRRRPPRVRLCRSLVVLALVVPGSASGPRRSAWRRCSPRRPTTSPTASSGSLGSTRARTSEGQTDSSSCSASTSAPAGGRAIGIPRDSWFDCPGRREDRINTAYATGGAELAARAVERPGRHRPGLRVATGRERLPRHGGHAGGGGGRLASSRSRPRTRTSRCTAGRTRFVSRSTAAGFAATRTLARGDFDRSREPPGAAAAACSPRLQRARTMSRASSSASASRPSTASTPATSRRWTLYRLLNALTSVDPERASGVHRAGTAGTSPAGGAIVISD